MLKNIRRVYKHTKVRGHSLFFCVSVLNYENVVETTSDTDDEDSFGGGGAGADEEEGSPAGVPALEASPRVGHALLSHRDQESAESGDGFQDPHAWRRIGESHGHL